MKLGIRIASAGASVIIMTMLGSCGGKVRLPFANVERSAACPAQKDIRCAPQLSHSTLLLNRAPVVVRLPSAGNPEFSDYIGALLHRNDRSGAYPRYCATPANGSPFRQGDIDRSSIDHSAAYRATLGRTLRVGAEADLAAAAERAGVLPRNNEAISAAFQAAVNRARTSQISADFRMLLVRLSVPAMNQLLWGNDPHFENCRAFLRANPDYRLVDSMTVFQITRASLANAVTRQIVLDFQASAAVPDQNKTPEQLASLEAAIRDDVATNINTESQEYYVIAALGLLDPGRMTMTAQ